MAPAGSDDSGNRDLPSDSDERRLRRRLDELDKRLDVATGRKRSGPSAEELRRRGGALGRAMRLATELVAGVFGGGLIGWLLDRWLGTLPLFLVVFLLLGIAAGLLNAVRAARQMGEGHTETGDFRRRPPDG